MISKENRFRGRRDPRIVLKHGKSVRSGPLQAKFLINRDSDDFRVAVMVSTKISKLAPRRNRIRRRIYETIRKNPPGIKGLDMVLNVHDEKLAKIDNKEVASLIDQIYQRIKKEL